MQQMQFALNGALKCSSSGWSLSVAWKIILREAGISLPSSPESHSWLCGTPPVFQPETSSFVQYSVSVVYLLLRTDKPEDGCSVFYNAFIDKHVVQITIQTLLHFSASPNNTLEASEQAAGCCLDVINAIMDSKGVFALVPRILKYGPYWTESQILSTPSTRTGGPRSSPPARLSIALSEGYFQTT